MASVLSFSNAGCDNSPVRESNAVPKLTAKLLQDINTVLSLPESQRVKSLLIRMGSGVECVLGTE
jgi:hypothetical protein